METVALTPHTGKREIAPSQRLVEALQYAARGWAVIPLHTPTPEGCSCNRAECNSQGKHPRTKAGLKQASKDETLIREWWNQWPEANVGIITGPESNLFVLDVDGEEGDRALQELRSSRPISQTLCCRTGRISATGERIGYHLYFTWPSGVDLRSSVGQLGVGLDLRAKGGYVVAPPSLHSTGLRYEWVDAESIVAAAPGWLIASASQSREGGVVGDEAAIPKGQRNSTLTSLAGAMRRKGSSPSAIRAALNEENLQRCVPPLLKNEVDAIAASVERYPASVEQPRKTRRPDVLCLADVQAEEVPWLWEPYIPRKMLTILSGDPGVGKTFLALELAASMTTGRTIISGEMVQPATVLYLTQENSPAHVLRPRFDALEGDPARFYILKGTIAEDGAPGQITLGDTEQLKEAIVRFDIQLVVIDPLQSFLGSDVDAHRANQTRPIMDGLIRLAEKLNCAIVITRHLSKGAGGSAIYRGMGSIDITGAARSELLVARDPDQPGRAVMAHSKSSLGRFGPSLSFSIDEQGKLQWHGESASNADDLLTPASTKDERGAIDEAEDFLRDYLAQGPQPAIEVQTQAQAAGISKATLRRAQDRLQVKKAPQEFKGPWMLSLPTVAQPKAELFIVSS